MGWVRLQCELRIPMVPKFVSQLDPGVRRVHEMQRWADGACSKGYVLSCMVCPWKKE